MGRQPPSFDDSLPPATVIPLSNPRPKAWLRYTWRANPWNAGCHLIRFDHWTHSLHPNFQPKSDAETLLPGSVWPASLIESHLPKPNTCHQVGCLGVSRVVQKVWNLPTGMWWCVVVAENKGARGYIGRVQIFADLSVLKTMRMMILIIIDTYYYCYYYCYCWFQRLVLSSFNGALICLFQSVHVFPAFSIQN